ncbi:hypothetical protein J2754_001085 [Halarchaeum solikamskense]|uniref:hypothetical protein n=1 Tax=Halarchaeum nitratireducens TaxID=489913 RepID=UPI001B3AE8B8|nr:hypothetical protein [Halarchaeum solikamskense]MBP2250768.1 hypothetical protein [Halarchaeum solikamskense]
MHDLDVDSTRDLPHPAHRLAEIWAAYGGRLMTPLSETNGRTLRSEVVEEDWVEYRVNEPGPTGDTFDVSEVEERRASTWLDAIAAMLAWYERARGRRGRLARGYQGEPEYEEFTIDLENSWQPSYCKREVARLKALERETVGGERPSGGETSPEYENPHSVILTLSGTSTPNGDRIGPADHDREIADSWTAGVYDALRYQLDKLGVSDYLYHKQGEPHPGDGPNVGYGHHHVMLMVDAGPLGAGDQTPRLEAAFREVIDKHVDVCDLAGSSAHGEGAISVRRVGDDDEEIESWSAYAAEYIASAEEDLLERSDQYVMWAATQWATGSQKATRSMTANSAIAADACKQRHESERSHQDVGHGERIVRSSRRGVDFECACCGSPWQIPQHYDTLTEARRETGARVLAADGSGGDLDDDGDTDRWDDGDIGDRWPSARAAASFGTKVDPHHGVCTEFESATRPPSWRMDAIIESSGKEKPATGSGVDMRELQFQTLPRTHGEIAAFLSDPATYVVCTCDVLSRSLDAWRNGECPSRCECDGAELRFANAAENWSLGSLSVDEWLSFLSPDPVVRELSFEEERELANALDRARRLGENTQLSPMGVVAQAGVPPEHLETAFEEIEAIRA